MERSRSMLGAAVLGLAIGVPLALQGWEGLRGMLAFLEQQSARLAGALLIALSIAVLVRQARRRSPAVIPPPGASRAPSAGERPGGTAPQPEPPAA